MTFALFAGLAGFALAAFSPGLLNDGDTYWHIRAGEWMLAHRAVLRTDVYALAGIIGGTVIVSARMEDVPAHLASFLGFFVCFAIRLCAIRYGWHLPAARIRGLSRE